MNPLIVEHQPLTSAQLAHELAQAVADSLHRAIATRGRALLAVSGGKSPIALFAALCTQPLEWSKVLVLLVDERCVAPEHADSNAALVRTHLLREAASQATFVPLFEQLPDPLAHPLDDSALDNLVAQSNQQLASLPWPLDVAVLGMGEDGHTASLFPDAPGLATALVAEGPLAWVRPATAPHARLTLTLPTLLAARRLHLPLSGPVKRRVYQQALQSADPALPVSLVLNHPGRAVQVWLA